MVKSASGDAASTGISNSVNPKRLVFFGDSLTSGYRIPSVQAYPSLIQQRLAFEGHNWIVKNAGVIGDSSEDGLKRVNKELELPIDLFVLALGVNDAEDGVSAAAVAANLSAIIERVKKASPGARLVVVGVRLSSMMSSAQQAEYGRMYAALGEKEKAVFISDLMDGIAGNEELMLSDRVHPNAAGHMAIAEKMWPVLSAVISK